MPLYIAALTGLQQTPFLSVLEPQKVSATLGALHLPVDFRVAPSVARTVCLRSGSKMVVAVSLMEPGNEFRVQLSALDCATGKLLFQIDRVASERMSVIRELDLCITELRKKLGEPAASLAKFNKPLDEATSASPDALQLLLEG